MLNSGPRSHSSRPSSDRHLRLQRSLSDQWRAAHDQWCGLRNRRNRLGQRKRPPSANVSYFNPDQLLVTIPGSFLQTPGKISIVVLDPTSKTVSDAAEFTLASATANITVSIPATVAADEPSSLSLSLNYPLDVMATLTMSFRPNASTPSVQSNSMLTNNSTTNVVLINASSTARSMSHFPPVQ
jgi:hypothetical protein